MENYNLTGEEAGLAHYKKKRLSAILAETGGLAVAFSGGVDSTFLLKAAHEVLAERLIAVTARSHAFPERELREAESFCRENSIKQIFVDSGELLIPGFRQNPKDRCYLCKRDLFMRIRRVAAGNGLNFVAEGSNLDDRGDYRPGLRAISELGIRSPLSEVELGKREIRFLSKEMGLPTFDKPSFACLYTRFPYGDTITDEKLSMVDRAEEYLHEMGFGQLRVRVHGGIARLELLPEDFPKLMEEETRDGVTKALKEFGFAFVTLDLTGYRTGSMNTGI